MNKTEKIVVQESKHPHYLEAEKVEINTTIKNGENGQIVKLTIHGKGLVTHGKHGTIKTESKHVIKYVQQELNPITGIMMSAFD
jgi:hypothetical protein